MEFGNSDWKFGHLLVMAYKARMEYQALDFDACMGTGQHIQYKDLRKELAKLYEIKDVSTKRSPI